jgi:hypothetical protein
MLSFDVLRGGRERERGERVSEEREWERGVRASSERRESLLGTILHNEGF